MIHEPLPNRTVPEPGVFRSTVYASGNLGKNLLWHSTEVALLFVFTELLGLPPALAGTLILVSLAIDAILDPIVGVLTERLRSPFGQYGPLLLIGSPLAALSFVGLFSLPLLDITHVAVIAGVLIVFRIGYTLIDIPHNAMLARISARSERRSSIAILRFLFSSLAALTISVALGGIAVAPDRLSEWGLFLFACTAGVGSWLVLSLVWCACRPYDRSPAHSTGRPSLREIGRAVVNNRQFLLVVGIAAVGSLSLPLFAKSMLYYSRYLLDDVGFASYCLTAMVVGQLVALPWWMHVARAQENKVALRWAHVTLFGVTMLFMTLPAGKHIAVALSFVVGAAASGVYSIIWAMIADCVERGQAVTGVRVEATLFALATLVQKACIGVGAWLFGVGLSLAGHQPGAPATQALQYTIEAFGMGLPALGAVVCILLLRYFVVTHEDHARSLGLLNRAPTVDVSPPIKSRRR